MAAAMMTASIKWVALPSRYYVKMSDRRETAVKVVMVVAALMAMPIAAIACIQDARDEVRRIFVGGSWKNNECTGVGTNIGAVIQLKPGANLSVRAAPNINAKETDRLQSGHGLDMCTKVTNKAWIGIVYHPDPNGDRADCRSPYDSEKSVPYRGPCKYGWVAARYIVNAAG
jgi:hypothetical protein